jgi:AhpD family alkylhydroperoxidase
MSAKEKLTAAKACMRVFAKNSPDLFEGFMLVSTINKCRGTYSTAQKKLVATPLAVAKGCDDCIFYHVDAARSHRADETALIEVLEVTIETGGGHALTYAERALEGFRALVEIQ